MSNATTYMESVASFCALGSSKSLAPKNFAFVHLLSFLPPLIQKLLLRLLAGHRQAIERQRDKQEIDRGREAERKETSGEGLLGTLAGHPCRGSLLGTIAGQRL